MTDKRLVKIVEFYSDLELFVDKYKEVPSELKDFALLRLGAEKAVEREGLAKASYIISKILKTTLGISLGKDDDFKGLFDDMDKKNTMH